MKTKGRLSQILKWLIDIFPPHSSTPQVRLRVVKTMPKAYHDCLGACVWNDKGEAMIWIKQNPRALCVPTLIHEYAHILCGTVDHDDSFYIQLGVLEREFEMTGQSDSTHY